MVVSWDYPVVSLYHIVPLLLGALRWPVLEVRVCVEATPLVWDLPLRGADCSPYFFMLVLFSAVLFLVVSACVFAFRTVVFGIGHIGGIAVWTLLGTAVLTL